MFRKAVIWGASGFIGINLAQRLVENGLQVICVSRTASPLWPASATALALDLRSVSGTLIDAMQEAYVFHLASGTRPSATTAGAQREVLDNVVSTLGYLEATRDIECRWVFASSGGTVYGDPAVVPISEDHIARPISSYGVAKLALEGYFNVYKAICGTDYSIARIANAYGPFQNPSQGQGLIAALIHKIMRGDQIEIWGNGEVVRDYIYVADVVDALSLIALKGGPGRTYNVGSGTGVSVNTLVTRISAHFNVEPCPTYAPARRMDVRSNVLDIACITRELSWTPQVDLESGIAQTIRWFADRAQVV